MPLWHEDNHREQIFLDIQPFGLATRAIMDDVGAGVLDARYNMTGTYSAWLTKVKGGAAMHQSNASVWILDDLSFFAQRNPVYGVVKFAVFVESDVTQSKSVKHVSNTSQTHLKHISNAQIWDDWDVALWSQRVL